MLKPCTDDFINTWYAVSIFLRETINWRNKIYRFCGDYCIK